MKRERGVTLIEMLLAVTLVSLLVVGILTAMRAGLNAMQKVNQRVMANRRAVGAQRILERQTASLMGVSADCVATGPQVSARIAFFQGEPETMRFVSSYSLEEANRGLPRILEFQVIPGEMNRGVRLVVNEHLYTGPLSTGLFCLGLEQDAALGLAVPRFRPVAVGPQSFVLADKLAYCRFLYQRKTTTPEPPRWHPRWVFPNLPSAVRVEMAPLEPDRTRVQPLSFIAPVMINRVTPGDYAD